ncbi:MAG: hypothetical protein EAZ57_10370 [Cytophagales bacterium]|nr:MAG: hypothetical protein EAZ67_07010 [Cytophagales bacterium]TAF59643.1 MAG: hypothetical protein EAZ57_10370 [Cytophagales bacterium]
MLLHRNIVWLPLCLALLLMLAFSGSFGLKAQGHFTIGPRMGIPSGEFAQNVDRTGFGIGASGLFPIGGNKSPLLIGGEAQYMLYGRNTIVRENTFFGLTQRYRIATNNNFASLNAVARLKPNLDRYLVEPYIDGIIGINFFYTNTVITDITNQNNNNNNDDDNVNNSNTTREKSDNTLCYGGAVGMLIGRGPVRLDLRCIYMLGGTATYVDAKSVRIDPDANGGQGEVYFSTVTSRTDMFMPVIGVTFMFGQ